MVAFKVAHDPITEERVGNRNHHVAVTVSDGADRLNPGSEIILVDHARQPFLNLYRDIVHLGRAATTAAYSTCFQHLWKTMASRKRTGNIILCHADLFKVLAGRRREAQPSLYFFRYANRRARDAEPSPLLKQRLHQKAPPPPLTLKLPCVAE